jgi:hypothetical protein
MQASTSGRVASASDAEASEEAAVETSAVEVTQTRTAAPSGPGGWRMDSKQTLEQGGLDTEFKLPEPGRSVGDWLKDQFASLRKVFASSKAARKFLHAIKQGDTASALDCLVSHRFLLAHHKFAQGGDTVRCMGLHAHGLAWACMGACMGACTPTARASCMPLRSAWSPWDCMGTRATSANGGTGSPGARRPSRPPLTRMPLLLQVWHVLAEYGDISLLQALTNFCKIHALPARYQAPKVRADTRTSTHPSIHPSNIYMSVNRSWPHAPV